MPTVLPVPPISVIQSYGQALAKEYVRLVEEYESRARANPRSYRWTVVGLGVLGYAYILFVLMTLALGTVLAAWLLVEVVRSHSAGLVRGPVSHTGSWTMEPVYLLVLVGLLVGLQIAILRALRVRIPLPSGVPVTGTNAPGLAKEVEAVRRELGAPPVHQVLITAEPNASILQAPRLGVFGWYRNYLLLGGPLLHALTRDQLRAILAHELGHLSGAHGRAGTWIYRVRATWEALEASFRRRRHFFHRFIEWFAPVFLAHAFVLHRVHELEADRAAAEIAGRAAAGAALARLALAKRLLDWLYWPELLRRNRDSPAPPAHAISGACEAVAGDWREWPDGWLTGALREPTTLRAPHPSLRQRLEGLGYEEEAAVRALLAETAGVPSAYEALVDDPRGILAALDDQWRDEASQAWASGLEERSGLRQRLEVLRTESLDRELSKEEVLERASLEGRVNGPADGVRELRTFLQEDPEHASGNYLMGQFRLETGDASGLRHLDTAMRVDFTLTPACCEAALEFLLARGRWEEAEPYRQRLEDYLEDAEVAAAERSPESLTPEDVALPHDLSTGDLESLLRYVRPREQIIAAYLVRKEVTVFPERPLYVLGIEVDWGECLRPPEEAAPRLLESLSRALVVPDGTLICLLNAPGSDWPRSWIEDVPGAEIYRRSTGDVGRVTPA